MFCRFSGFQSTRPIRGATVPDGYCSAHKPISIHAPHTGRDVWITPKRCKYISFQSTRPIRGATSPRQTELSTHSGFQSTRPIRGATHQRPDQGHPGGRISIHAPHTGRDVPQDLKNMSPAIFQSTRPIRGATMSIFSRSSGSSPFQSTRPIRGATLTQTAAYPVPHNISIHAPHTGRDQSRPSCGGNSKTFQSTRPIRGATAKMHNLCSAFLQQQTIKA